jgi:Cu/Ag efflux protein CusF
MEIGMSDALIWLKRASKQISRMQEVDPRCTGVSGVMQGPTMKRRQLLAWLVAAPVGVSLGLPLAAASPPVEVWKDPTCGCCKEWIAYLRNAGFTVTSHDSGNVAARAKAGIAAQYGSCHTALVDGYAIEGHVPVRRNPAVAEGAPGRHRTRCPGDGRRLAGHGAGKSRRSLYSAAASTRRWQFQLCQVPRLKKKPMMRIVSLTFVALLVASPLPALACNDHAPGTEPAHRPVARVASLAAGEVREVDLEERTITLGHGKIASLRMAPMSSMIFKASDIKLLANLNPGDKVNFRAIMIGPQPTITQISLAKK